MKLNNPMVLFLGLVVCSWSQAAWGAAAEPEYREVREATVEQAGGLYLTNRAPLRPTAFLKLPPGAIVPRGWLRHQLELDASGLVGRMPEISRYLRYEQNGWVDPRAQDGWEEMPYWLRGYGDLGYVLGDKAIIATAPGGSTAF